MLYKRIATGMASITDAKKVATFYSDVLDYLYDIISAAKDADELLYNNEEWTKFYEYLLTKTEKLKTQSLDFLD